jgi:hypothetical protein
MPGFFRLWAAAALLGLALAAAPAAAQDIHINPVPPHVKPQWTPVPSVPGVFYAPNLPTDVFRHGGKYYFYWEGYLYRGSKPRGPWKSVTQPPAWFTAIDPAIFKTLHKEATPAPAPPAGPAAEVAPTPPTPMPPAEVAPAPPAPKLEEAPTPAPTPEKEEAPAPPAAPVNPPKVM